MKWTSMVKEREMQTRTPDSRVYTSPELLISQAECMLLEAECMWAMTPEMESTQAVRDLSPAGR